MAEFATPFYSSLNPLPSLAAYKPFSMQLHHRCLTKLYKAIAYACSQSSSCHINMTFAKIVALGLHLMVATCCENGSTFDKNNKENSCISTSIFWFHVSHRLRCSFLLWKDTSACVQHFTSTIFRHYCLLLLWKHHFSAEGNPSYTAIEKQQLFEMSY